MKRKAIDILDQHRLMAVSTVRPDGWPQCTMVSYANEDLLIYCLISRQSQKFANIVLDDRVSLGVGEDFDDPATIKGLSIGGRASEVTNVRQWRRAVDLIMQRQPVLRRLQAPDRDRCVVMRVRPEIITILDYSKGLGHSDLLTVGLGGIVRMTAARDADWGFGIAAAAVPETRTPELASGEVR